MSHTYSIIKGDLNMSIKSNDHNTELLYNAVLSLKNMDDCKSFFEDLCTIPEIKAMAQRLTVAKMLHEKRVYSDIVSETGASTATISRVNRSLLYGNNGYEKIFERIDAKSKTGDV